VYPTTSTSDENSYESVFRLKQVHPDQSGEFECRPEGLPTAHVNLHVVKGEAHTPLPCSVTRCVGDKIVQNVAKRYFSHS
jgi:hypothetical protein